MWPAVGALGAALVVIGLVTYPIVFVFGIIVLSPPRSSGWCRRGASGRPATPLQRGGPRALAHPLSSPSSVCSPRGHRLLVQPDHAVPLQDGRPAAFAVLAALVLVAGSSSPSPQPRQPRLVGVADAVLALVAGGVAAALDGEREIEEHERRRDRRRGRATQRRDRGRRERRAERRRQGQRVGEIVLASDGTLVAKTRESTRRDDHADVPASQPDERDLQQRERRRAPARARPRRTAAVDENGETSRRVVPTRCTALVEDGGSQLMTFGSRVPGSSDDDPYHVRRARRRG